MHVYIKCAAFITGVYYSTNGGSSWAASTGPQYTINGQGVEWRAIASSSSGQIVVTGSVYQDSTCGTSCFKGEVDNIYKNRKVNYISKIVLLIITIRICN